MASVYLQLDEYIIDQLLLVRNVATKSDKIEALISYDKANPTVIEKLTYANLKNLFSYTLAELELYLAIHNIKPLIPILWTKETIVDYIVLSKTVDSNDASDIKLRERLISKLKIQGDRKKLELLLKASNLNCEYINLLTIEQMVETLKVNDIFLVDDGPIKRYHYLTTHKYHNILAKYYGIREISQWQNIVNKKPAKIEQWLDMLADNKLDEIVSRLSIITPRGLSVKEYLISNIVDYKHVINRTNPVYLPLDILIDCPISELYGYFRYLTDREIVSLTGAYLFSNTREELLSLSVNFVINTTKEFFIPVGSKYTVNNETIMGTPIDDADTLFFAYGTAMNYRIYEVEDMIGSFYTDSNSGIFEFRRPESPDESFTKEEINWLLNLCMRLSNVIGFDRLIDHIEEGKILMILQENKELQLIKEAGKLSGEEKENLRKILYQLFYCGMYSRRWKGPPHPYPILKNSTTINIDPTDKVGLELDKFSQMLTPDTINIIKLMRTYKWSVKNRTEIKGDYSLSGLLTEIRKGNYCIRVASSYLVYTSYRYLSILLKENIPDFDYRRVESIF